jgi:predicted NBD/HSP70 family sugar kinase
LDPGFVPAELWNRSYETRVAASADCTRLAIALSRPDGTVFRHDTTILAHEGENIPLNCRYVERILKLLLWTRGGSEIVIGGSDALAREISRQYRPGGQRSFDCDLVGRRVFLDRLRVSSCEVDQVPGEMTATTPLGGYLEGCRIGFDLGGSDRKCAAVIDGEVMHSEEVVWNPYFESDPQYHYSGIEDSLQRAAAHLPHVDGIGGSAAGVYIDSQPRAGALFRGISEDDFDAEVRPLFSRLQVAMGNVPFKVVNDGEVTALAASMYLHAPSPLGIAMGTSLASGYCDADGHITNQLNELAFAPVDYRPDAPADEWSTDRGCGAQYFSQQAVARLAPVAGIDLSEEMPLAERLVEVQSLMDHGDPRARKIFATIGSYLGYSIAWFARWYEIESVLILGRVMSGAGGDLVIRQASQVMHDEFPELVERIRLVTPDEKFKRHGQAIAAASLPRIES